MKVIILNCKTTIYDYEHLYVGTKIPIRNHNQLVEVKRSLRCMMMNKNYNNVTLFITTSVRRPLSRMSYPPLIKRRVLARP